MREITGTHLLIDGYVEDARALEPEPVIAMFDDLVEMLEMRYLQRPMAMRVPLEPSRLLGEQDEGGWSIFAQITTSHLALHGWPLRRAFMADVFSCQSFDGESAKQFLWARLGVDRAVCRILDRRGPIPDDAPNAVPASH